MATPNFADNLSGEGAMEGQNDPFMVLTPERDARHRYSTFDSQVFALGPNASPAQAKRALEAHLAETDRRMEEAGKLGTALVQQRNELEERLREVEKLEAEGQLSQELRQKLVEIEKDYNEVARESARAFLPKPRVPSNEVAAGSPYVPEGKGGRRSVSPSKFEAQATGSPTKLSVPNRKVRNQPTNRIHDIEFAAEISTSLIAQVRNLQGLLAEKEEELRDVKLEKSKLEYDAEGFQQRIKVLDESESRYKDENWSLETQVHELMAAQKESSDREKKLQQTINILQSEKNTAQRELDEVKASHSKLFEEHAATVKHLDTEMGAAKRNMAAADTDRVLMQRRIDELTSQNQELAKAVSLQRGRLSDRQEILTMSDGDFETAHDGDTPEHSPPPSPVKGTPRHSLLESETLKTSLHHAQRTIQSLRTNVHREKTEKLELRRMLQDARDELEKTRNDPLASSKRARKADSREFKKSARLLGNLRSARSEIFTEDPNWEDQTEGDSPNRSMYTHSQRGSSNQFEPVMESIEHDDFETAAETSDQAFETANERGTGTETDDFHTGAEEFSSEDDVETETESPSKRRIGTLQGRPPSLSLGGVSLARSNSLHSTASTDDEYSYVEKTPAPQLPELKGKFQLRVSRGSARRSRQFSEEPPFTSSPASFATSSAAGTPQPHVQSLAAELGDFDGSDNDSTVSATPSRRSTLMSSRPGSIRGVTASPPPPVPPLPKVIMVDSGMMTEPVPELLSPPSPSTVVGAVPMDTVHESGSEDGGVELEENLAKFPVPPVSPKKEVAAHAAEMEALRQEHAEQIEKLRIENAAAHDAALEALKAGHADELTRSLGEAKSSHGQEIDALKTRYADDLSRSLDEVRASHATEIEALTANHGEQLSRSLDEARSSHLQELDALKANHGDELTRSLVEARGSHSQEIEGLKANHADQLARSVDEVKAAHALEIEALKSGHAELSSKSASEAAEAHARELEALQATHAEKLAQIEVESKTAHVSELESLKASHLEQLESLQKQSDATLAEQLESLRQNSEATLAEKLESLRKESDALHAEQLDSLQKQSDATLADKLESLRKQIDATHAEELARLETAHAAQMELATEELLESHAKELASLKAGHIEQIEQAQKTTDLAHAEQLKALKLAHLGQVEETKNSILEAHTRELEALKAAHATQIEQSKKETEAAHNLEVEALIASHLAQLESSKTEAAQQLATAIESLKAVHQKELESSKAESVAALAKEIDALKASHASELASSKAEGEAKLAKEIETLRTAHAQEIETLKTEHDATLARELASLKTAHAQQLEESKTQSDAAQAAAIAVLVSQHAMQLESTKSEADATLSRELAAVKDTHAREIDDLKTKHAAAHAEELEGFKAALAKQVESSKSEGDATHSQQIEALNAAHAEIIEAHKRDSEKAMEQALESLKASHGRQIETIKSENATVRSKELDDLSAKHHDELDVVKAEYVAAKALEIETLVSTHDSDLEAVKAQAAADKAKDIEALASKHRSELETLRAEAEAEKAKEIEIIVAKHSHEIEALRTEAAATTAKEIEKITSKHNGELEMVRSEAAATKAKELEELSASYNQRVAELNAELAATKAKALEELAAQHESQIVALKNETSSSKSKELDDLSADHSKQIQALKADHDAAIAKVVEELSASHVVKIEAVKAENEAAKAKELESLRAALRTEFEAEQAKELDRLKSEHALVLDRAKAEHETALNASLQNLMVTHAQEIDTLKNDHSVTHAEALNSLQSSHSRELEALKAESAAALAGELDAVKAEHQQLLQGHQTESSAEIEKLLASHAQQIDALKNEHSATHTEALDSLQSRHAQELEAIKAESAASLAQQLDLLKSEHQRTLGTQQEESAASLAQELDLLRAEHQRTLEAQQEESAASLARELNAARTEHHRSLEAHRAESSAEREKMVASHALELEALRKSLTLKRPALNYSSMSTVETEPIAAPMRSPKREAFIIPREMEKPQTPPPSSIGIFGKKGMGTDALIIAEDETRQSPSAARGPETPESERPFKEMSNNTDARTRKEAMATPTHDQGAQTLLTSDALDKMLLLKQRRGSQGSFVEGGSPATIRHRRSQDSIGSVIRTRGKMSDTGVVAGPESIPGRRPGSSASGRGTMQDAPPLPANHREAIEAARAGPPAQTPGSPGKASMGPPLLPASAYKNAATATRPRTPHDNQPQHPPLSPTSGRGTPTPRPVRTGSSQGYADVHSPIKMTARSRQSSVSSFASEIETRFNIRGDMSMEAAGLAGPGTDPRMIQAITQTMIGEYLWKYTRKTGRGEMSENRHRRYFWVHPYTRTLYWSDRDPSTAAGGRSELKAKSVPIEAVRVVTDDNPMPPGLHRKSLIILSPGRTIKFTCTTGQRHETWFNALSYLLLRTGDEGQADTEEMANNITQEDIDEFNPQFGRRPPTTQSNRPRAPPSISSYNSRTTRNESPNVDFFMSIPTLTPTHERHATKSGTLGRLSGYWKNTASSGNIFNSLRGRSHPANIGSAIYEASEVHDSAEDLRQMIEQQDRESERLENVRACCEGKHDVGTLSHSSKRNRQSHSHSHTHTHPGQPTTPTPMSTVRSRA